MEVNKGSTRFNYTKQDSLFKLIGQKNNKKQKNIEINVDSKQELLDFSNNKLKSRNKPAKTLAKKSININSVDVSTLVLLPGIGNKTANNIVKYRRLTKKFKALEDLMNVKGIGKKKFNKIKKYLIIEK